MEQYIKQEVYNLDGNTQLEFLNRKTIVVVDKDRFSICKQLLLENARDEDFAEFLNIPPEKVRYFKYKMQLFEDKIRARRRAARLNSKRRRREAKPPPQRKREISSEERFRRARDLIARNYSTNQISKILKVSERSVTRFKSRIRAEKMRLAVEGKLKLDPDDPDDQNSFKHLKPQDKVRRAQELFKRRLRITEISEILKISERSVRRWKEKLNKLANAPPSENDETLNIPKKWHPERNLRSKVIKMKSEVEENDDEESEHEKPPPKKRKMFVDREKVQYARELIENKLSNKEMSMLLEMSIACVRKLKMKILNGTVEELIDNSEEHYASLMRSNDGEDVEVNPDVDPLDLIEPLPEASTSIISLPPPGNYGYERKPKVVLRDREMFMCRLLRENNVRTMDIAKMMKISERSVTRLLAKSRELEAIEYEADLVADVEKMLADKDTILDDTATETSISEPAPVQYVDDNKRKLGLNLLSMNVKPKDIAKMLDVCEKTVLRWKLKMRNAEQEAIEDDEDENLETNDYLATEIKQEDDDG